MNDSLQQGITAFRAGNRNEARKFLIAAVKQDHDNEQTWGWLYNVANNDKERIECLQQILRINPKHEKAKQLLDELNNSHTLPLLSSKEGGTGDQYVASSAENTKQVPAIEIDKNIRVDDEKAIIKRQYIAFFVTFVLFIPATLASLYISRTMAYGMLILIPMMVYIGISSIRNRVSIARIRGDPNGYSKGTLAVVVGISMIIICAANTIIVLTPLFSDIFHPSETTLPTTIAENGFTTVFVLDENASSASNQYKLEQLGAGVVLGLGIIGCIIFVGVHLVLRRKIPRYVIQFAIMAIVIGAGGLNIIDQTDGSLVRDCIHIQTLYDSQQYEIIEGIVHVLHSQPITGHDKGDIISIGNAELEVNHFLATCAYRTTIAYGGVLTENTYARIYYVYSGGIARIDIKKP